MKRLAFLLLAVATAGCDVEPYPFGNDRGDTRLQVQITPLGAGRWITSGGTQYYACYFDAAATVTGSNPGSWISLGNPRVAGSQRFGYVVLSGSTGSTVIDITPQSIWASLFRPPAPPPAGPGGGLYTLGVGEQTTISNQWVGSTNGPFTYRVTLGYLERGGQGYSYDDELEFTISCP